MKVNSEGVPNMVQRVRYIYSSCLADITLFTGTVLCVEPLTIMRYPPHIMQRDFTPEQFQDAYAGAEILMAKKFTA